MADISSSMFTFGCIFSFWSVDLSASAERINSRQVIALLELKYSEAKKKEASYVEKYVGNAKWWGTSGDGICCHDCQADLIWDPI